MYSNKDNNPQHQPFRQPEKHHHQTYTDYRQKIPLI